MTWPDIRFIFPDDKELIHEVLVKSGYIFPHDIHSNLFKETEKSVERVIRLIKPGSIGKTAKIVNYDKGYIEGNGLMVRSNKLAMLLSKLHGVETICCFAVTLGEGIDKAIRESMHQSVTRAFLMDIAGTIIVERFASQVEDQIRKQNAKDNLACTARFSPGYCDWEIESGQDSVFAFLKPGSIGIRKQPSGMMIPQKTITAVMIGARRIVYKTPCYFCRQKTCPFRRDQEKEL